MTDVTRLSASQLSEKLINKEITSVELTQAHLDRISHVDQDVHAFLHINEQALEQARIVDEKRAAGEPLSALAGLPVAVKDILCTQDQPTTAASKILEGYQPPFDATVVEKLRSSDAILIGKTNLDEFAMGSSTEFSAYGTTRNPWDLDRVPGGSGGGSAAALAAFMSPLALGSDTGGSIRQPAAVTGTVGMKPTYGGVSRYGAIALASSLDQVGPAARNVLDAAMLHDVIGGYDNKDSTSLNQDWGSFTEAVRQSEGSLKGLRVGVVKELSVDGFQPGVKTRFDEAVQLMADAGAEIVEISTPNFEYAISAYYLILPAEASSNLAKFDSVRFGLRVNPENGGTVEDVMSLSRDVGFGPEVKRRIILGTYALSAGFYDAYYGKAQRIRTLIQRDFVQAFEKADILISPSAPTTAFKIGERISDPLSMYLNDLTTTPANMAGVPAIGMPIGLAEEDDLPVGIQIMAPLREDARVYRAAAELERLLEESWQGRLLDRIPELAGRDA